MRRIGQGRADGPARRGEPRRRSLGSRGGARDGGARDSGTVVAVRGVDVDVEGEGARRRLRVDVREDDAQPLVCRSVRLEALGLEKRAEAAAHSQRSCWAGADQRGWERSTGVGVRWVAWVEARAFDALELEAEPLLVHGSALLQLGELLLVLQVVLLEGCAQATHTTRSARARRSNGRGGWAGPSPEHAPRSRSWRSSRCCSSWRLSCCSSGGSVAWIAVSRCSSRRSSSIRCESSFARWLSVSSAPWIAESSS